MTSPHKTHHVDYAVVGSGIAGLRAAIELSAAGSVLVLAKSNLSDSATAWAQGGIAVALSDEDEIGLHEQDTLNAGDGLCRPEAVALLVEEGPKYITQLIEWGTEFDRAGTRLAFTREAAHSRSRILHAHGDSTGREISRALLARAHSVPQLHLGAPRFLLSEALRGEGGVLRNIGLERFMKKYHEAQELAPRDVVARAIVSEMQRTQSTHVYLDMTKKSQEFLKKRFPRIYETCLSYGLDLASDLAPVCPAAHYMMGGVKTDLKGHTSLPGLYAAGETAATGVHGANRLASNSLVEGLGVGALAGQAMMKDAPAGKRKGQALPGSPAPLPGNGPGVQKEAMKNGGAKNGALKSPAAACATLTKIRELMWHNVGIMRNGKELAEGIKQLEGIELPKCEKSGRSGHELRNLHTLALVMARAARAREESRGSHYRSDFPFRNDEDFAKHSAVQKGKDVRFEV